MTNPARIVLLLPIFLVACGGNFPLFGAVEAPEGNKRESAKERHRDLQGRGCKPGKQQR